MDGAGDLRVAEAVAMSIEHPSMMVLQAKESIYYFIYSIFYDLVLT
jgi:hypothetical protein